MPELTPLHDSTAKESRPAFRQWGRIVKAAVILLIFGFVFRKLGANIDELRHGLLNLRWPSLALSFPFAVAYLIGRSMIWHLIVRRCVSRFPLHKDMLSWMISVVGKYIPGKVFLLLGRVHFYRGSEATAAKVSLCFLIEACCSSIAALAVFGLAFLGRRTETEGIHSYTGTAAAAIVVFLAATHPAILGFAVNTLLRFLKRPPVRLSFRWVDVWFWTFLMMANWMVLGTGFFLLIRSFADLSFGNLLYVTGSFALAGAVGILCLFAPSGIGVREGVMTLILGQIMPPGVAAMTALLSRVWITLAEVLCAGLALFLSQRLGAKRLTAIDRDRVADNDDGSPGDPSCKSRRGAV
jgi:hypothetical protein